MLMCGSRRLSCEILGVAAGNVFEGSEKAGPDAGGVEQFPL